jgi:glycosyltransferase involved in cell wall biosynthesis
MSPYETKSMQRKLPVTVVIPVLNEATNLRRCLEQLERFAEIVVVDSDSTDRTITIAEEFETTIIRFKWDGRFPKKRNWFLRNHAPQTPWVLFLDADEVIDDKFCDELDKVLPTTRHNGFWITYDNWFMGKRLKFGTPNRKLALFRVGAGEYEQINENQWSLLDMEIHEHPVLSGSIGEIQSRVEHFDHRGLNDWMRKHVEYAIWEAKRWEQLQLDHSARRLSSRQGLKYRYLNRWWLSVVYFLDNYLRRGGLFDGYRGFVHAIMKSLYFWQVHLLINETKDLDFQQPSLTAKRAIGSHIDRGKPRILHVLESIDPREGGPPSVALSLAAAQARHGNWVGILSQVNEAHKERINKSFETIPGIEQVHFFSVSSPNSKISYLTARDITDWLVQNRSQFDILHIHKVFDPVVRAAAKAAWKLNIPYVIMPHGSLDPWSMHQTKFKYLKKHFALIGGYRRVLNRSLFLHALNQGERDGFKELNLSAKTEIIANGVFLQESGSLPPKGVFRSDHPALASRPFVLFLSRLHYMKGLDYLVAGFAIALKEIPNLRLVVAGPDFGCEQEIRDQVSRLGLEHEVIFVGPIYGSKKYAALIDADVYGLTSRHEGFSVALLEALACGCPVVITPECRFPDVATSGAGKIVAPRADQIAEAIIDILKSKDSQEMAALAAKKLVFDNYSWDKISLSCLNAYTKHLSKVVH